MQATVRSYDPETRSGTVLLDDGVELPYDGAAFEDSELRHLRIGQRVTVETADKRVSALWLYTVPPVRGTSS